MPIFFEKGPDFNNLPDGVLYGFLAETYLIGKKFGSLEEALNQEWRSGCTLAAHGFKIAEIQRFTPKNLPAIINEVEIEVPVRYRNTPEKVSFYLRRILRARYEEESTEANKS